MNRSVPFNAYSSILMNIKKIQAHLKIFGRFKNNRFAMFEQELDDIQRHGCAITSNVKWVSPIRILLVHNCSILFNQ